MADGDWQEGNMGGASNSSVDAVWDTGAQTNGCPLCQQYEGREYSAKTLAALNEDLTAAKSYGTAQEMFAAILLDVQS
jgi:hypothetical protein